MKIKFNCDWIKTEITYDITEINKYRSLLYKKKLIGFNNIGYGNISIRTENGFLISGSTTGKFPILTIEHYTEVIELDFEKNYIICRGPIKASSESLSHAALYTNPKVNAVIHIHNLELWNKLIDKVPTTSENSEYGTPELAYEIMKLKSENIIAMGGHKEGILTFGNKFKDAYEALGILL